jgi:cyanuric acid amidohydrolase
MRTASIHAFEMAHPGDTSGLERALDDGVIRVDDIVCIMGKTEGNGLDNDHTRAFATQSILSALGRRSPRDEAELAERILLVLSGGTEGVTNPHITVFTARETTEPAGAPALGIARAIGRSLDPAEIGSWAQTQATADAVRQALATGGFRGPDDVGYVLVKAALVPSDLHGSKPGSRAASALGVALALGEVTDAAARAAGRDR